jgi:hypothetical protein
VALVVESTLRSTYGEHQIRRYLEWVKTDFAGQRYRGLLMLTALEDPLSEEDVAFAADAEIVNAGRWADLHKLLEPLSIESSSQTARVPSG